MSRDFDNIKDINDGKEIWKLAVRLEDLWKSGVGKNEHMEFLILDKQGDSIQVLLPADLCPLWGPKLHEGSTYVMKNFKVQPNDFSVKFCDHSFKLVLVGGDGGSDVIPTKIPNLPNYTLNFKPFSEFKKGNYRSDLLFGTQTHLILIMASTLDFLGEKPIATFAISFFSGQIYPEIEPEFIRQHYNSIKNKWHVLNNFGDMRDLIFNKDYEFPLIKRDWNDFKTVKNLQDNVEVKLNYHNPSVFSIHSYKPISSATEIPPFFSQSTKPLETKFFDIVLTDDNIVSNQLGISHNFGKFLKEKLIYFLQLGGDNEITETTKIIDIADPTKTKLGKN